MDQAVRRRKLALMGAPHVRPLMELIERWEATSRKKFPKIDPEDGGVRAEVLFLQHTPGGDAPRSEFVSRDNEDPTARRANEFLSLAGFERSDYARWNVVPFYTTTGKATGDEIRKAAETYTKPLMALLPKLSVVVFCGGPANEQRRLLGLPPRGVTFLETFHCGARWPSQHEHTLATFRRAHSLMLAARERRKA